MVQEALSNVRDKQIALAMIVKATDDEAPLLEKALESVQKHVDGVFLLLNHKPGEKPSEKVIAIAKQYDPNFSVMEWTYFGDMRRLSFEAVTDNYGWIFWLDSDDTVKNPEGIRKLAENAPATTNGIYLNYEYEHDEFGNPTVEHYVARLVRNNGSFKWSDKKLHESLEPVRNGGKGLSTEVVIVHHADAERQEASNQRNLIALEEELKGEGDAPDPRTLFYLGRSYVAAGRLDEAKELFTSYLKLSGWKQERCEAWMQLGKIYDLQGNDREMKEAYLHALDENPREPGPLVERGMCEMRNEMWEEAIVWLEMAVVKKFNPSTMVSHTSMTKYRNYMYLAQCNFKLGKDKIDLALKWANLAVKLRPDKVTKDYRKLIISVIHQRHATEAHVKKLEKIAKKTPAMVIDYINNLPEEMQDNPAILRYKRRYGKPKIWPKKSVVIFVGNSVIGEWGPWSLNEGIGGSEEAVIRLSKKLTDLGWAVTVYCTPGHKAGIYDKVEYRNYWEASLADTFDVFISWRSPWFFDAKINARKKYLWLHDVMDKEEFTKERIDNIDKVIVLSEYHRSIYPMIPDEKIFLSGNGIDPEDFEACDGNFKRDPHRVIYMSSHVRGLQLIYEIWNDVRKAVPKAKLDIYYGWESYVNVNRDNPERMAWMNMMQEKVKILDGVTDHGKVSQSQIVEEIFKSGVWAYPCPFPEIYCITAIKAQAGGAIPVSSDFAALKETVKFGEIIPMKAMNENTPVGKWDKKDLKAFKDALIKTLKNPSDENYRKSMMNWARTQSWHNVAKNWEREFES